MAVSDEDRRTKVAALADKVWQQALDGDMSATRTLLDRIDGPVAQVITGEGGGPVTFTIRLKDVADDDGE